MEEVAFNDWPGSPVDLNSGNNPWLPAYGFHTPATLLEKEDFIGNPDAEYFLQSGNGQFTYLETIQEETSDDLRSDSDVESRRASPVGWLATDSESGSVICIENSEDIDCYSDRELACPAKRRKQELFLTIPNANDEEDNLSRSSSLVQFETLEKECQESSSPSLHSQFSFDSLETTNHKIIAGTNIDEIDFLAKLDSGSESSDSDITIDGSRSYDNLRTWRSLEGLQAVTNRNHNNSCVGKKEKVSAENLSEDSGYSDHIVKTNNLENKNVMINVENTERRMKKKSSYVGFPAYDGDVFQNFNGNFGTSYQDLSIFEKLEANDACRRSPLIDAFLRKKMQQQQREERRRRPPEFVTNHANMINLDAKECRHGEANFNSKSSSAPNLLETVEDDDSLCGVPNACSVPKNLNFLGDFNNNTNKNNASVAEKDWNLADLRFDDDTSVTDEEMATYRREGSYCEAMSNRVDISDDEGSLRYKNKLPKSPIVDFDKRVLKAISEQSLQSILSSTISLNSSQKYLNQDVYTSTPSRRMNVASSTPDLNRFKPVKTYDDRRKSTQEINEIQRKSSKETAFASFEPKSDVIPSEKEVTLRRKTSIIKSSTSTSGMSDIDDRTLRNSVKSFTGSTSSKGVHFSPVVAEVNWRDDNSQSTATPERESTYSLDSSSSAERDRSPPKLVRPKPRLSGSPMRLSMSQPELSDTDSYGTYQKEFVDSLKNLRKSDLSKSQPEIRRRGSQLYKQDKDGYAIKSYVDRDGVQYKHTHLDLNVNIGGQHAVPHHHHHQQNQQQQQPQNFNGKQSGGQLLEKSGASSAMEDDVETRQHRDASKTKHGKLGGFFQRLASFRFSAKKGAEEKAKAKKKQQQKQHNNAGSNLTAPQQRVATKDDYIFIPLKGPPTAATNNNNNGVASKPPLPKQPPRVVHASVKRDVATAQSENDRRRRKTIDSAGVSSMDQPMGLIETDLDTEVTVITNGAHVKTRSLLNLGAEPRLTLRPEGGGPSDQKHRPHKSMEFLLDKQNLKVVEPPENELQKGERVMSEHQLRVQRSLQKLTVPDWYKQSQVPREGFLLKKTAQRETRWTGTSGSRTTSLSSLGSSQGQAAISPTPCNQPFVRWSTSKLNSTASSPCQSTRSSFNARQANGSVSPSSVRSSFSYRQPYLGWRSQERLSRPRTPAERLASSILNGRTRPEQPQEESPEIQTSIKEVTSAIVHYVSGLKPEERSQDVSPRGSQKLCWLESSFVGVKPLDSPQTPVTLSEGQIPPAQNLRLDLQGNNDMTLLTTGGSMVRPSPSSTTLEDVLDSLLGLPTSGRAPSPCLQVTASASTSPCRHPESSPEHFRRRSEGSEPTPVAFNQSDGSRRVSIDSSPVLRCRYSRCAKTTLATSHEAQSFKNCHNCSYTYCSRACRRAHWEKHRKTCLFSRIGTLCRQVIAAAKEQKDSLRYLSQTARRGFISHGPGAVKCFFPTPEAAERFLSEGFQCLGELTFVRWQDLLPTEMGPQLYEEIVRMCKSYNADTKLILYVSVCVVSETPASGAVKWERQLVSRCAKMRLSRDVSIPDTQIPIEGTETLILTCAPIKNRVRGLRGAAVDKVRSELRERGVSLERHHPDIFKQLEMYREDVAEKFKAVTVYPKDVVTGKSFMCIIMLESEEESLKKVEKAGVRVKTVDVLRISSSGEKV